MEATGNQAWSGWGTGKSKIAYRIIATLRAIHSRGYVHRDIKPLNIFLDESYNAVIGDWGLARPLDSCSASGIQVNPTAGIGTLAFMAPELFDDDSYDQSVDIFAWGIVVYAMHARGAEINSLFADGAVPGTKYAFYMKIRDGIRYKYLNDSSSPWWRLISQCWSHDPASRPTAAQICAQIAWNPEPMRNNCGITSAWLDKCKPAVIQDNLLQQCIHVSTEL
jgi:serine/threonine protein kinase